MLVILLFVSASAVSHRQGFYQYVFIKNRLNKNCPLKCRCYEIDIHRKNNRKLHSLYGLVYLFFFSLHSISESFFLSYHKYRRLYNPSIIYNIRGGSRTAATFKMELFVIIVNGWKSSKLIYTISTFYFNT